MRSRSELRLHRYGGSWASSFTTILQEQMDERVWQKRTLCTAAATTAAAPHRRTPRILQAREHQVGEEKHICTQHNNFTGVSFFSLGKKKGTSVRESNKKINNKK